MPTISTGWSHLKIVFFFWVDFTKTISSREIYTYTSSLVKYDAFSFIIIGIMVSRINWFSQSHCHGFKRISIKSKLSQRPNKCAGKIDKLLFCSWILKKKNNKNYMIMVENNVCTSLITGHSSVALSSDPGRLIAFGSISDKCGLFEHTNRFNPVKPLKLPFPTLCKRVIYDILKNSNFFNGGNTLQIIILKMILL